MTTRPQHARYSALERSLSQDLRAIAARVTAYRLETAMTPIDEELLADLEYLLWDAHWSREEYEALENGVRSCCD